MSAHRPASILPQALCAGRDAAGLEAADESAARQSDARTHTREVRAGRHLPEEIVDMAADSALASALNDRAKFTEWVEITLRATDIDRQGHVNNSVHPILFIDGRTSFMQ